MSLERTARSPRGWMLLVVVAIAALLLAVLRGPSSHGSSVSVERHRDTRSTVPTESAATKPNNLLPLVLTGTLGPSSANSQRSG